MEKGIKIITMAIQFKRTIIFYSYVLVIPIKYLNAIFKEEKYITMV